MTPRELVFGGHGWLDAREVHSYSEYIEKIGDLDRMDLMSNIIYNVGERIQTILVLVLVAIGLVVYAGLAPNRYASMASGVVGLVAAALFVVAVRSAFHGDVSVLDFLTGVPVKVRGFFGSDLWTFRLSWGWYMIVVGSLFALWGGKERY